MAGLDRGRPPRPPRRPGHCSAGGPPADPDPNNAADSPHPDDRANTRADPDPGPIIIIIIINPNSAPNPDPDRAPDRRPNTSPDDSHADIGAHRSAIAGLDCSAVREADRAADVTDRGPNVGIDRAVRAAQPDPDRDALGRPVHSQPVHGPDRSADVVTIRAAGLDAAGRDCVHAGRRRR